MKEVYKSKELILEEGEKMVLEYYLAEKEYSVDGNIGYVRYGIEVKLKKYGQLEIESERIDDVFSSIKEAENFLDVLYNESVTPCTLSDVVHDKFLGELL